MENITRSNVLNRDEVQVLESALLATGFESQIDEIVSRINTLEWIDAVRSMLQIPSENISQWIGKKRLVLFLVKKIMNR